MSQSSNNSSKEPSYPLFELNPIFEESNKMFLEKLKKPFMIKFLWDADPQNWNSAVKILQKVQLTNVKQIELLLTQFHNENVNFFSAFLGKTTNAPQYEKQWVDELFPFLIKVVLDAPKTLQNGLPILQPFINAKITMTRVQALTIMALALFGLLGKNVVPKDSSFPNLDLVFFLCSKTAFISPMSCLLEYFSRCQKKLPEGFLIVERKFLTPAVIPNWKESSTPLLKNVVIKHDLTIEDSDSVLHADFANKYIGGGVLTGGNVQEEILFVIKPECLVTLLFCPMMMNDETIIITDGFNWSFDGPFIDESPRDPETKTFLTEVVAMDAIVSFGKIQFEPDMFFRDLNKAYCGFYEPNPKLFGSKKIGTGNWGCGAFGGDKGLKFVQQLLAASQTGREMFYSTFREIKTYTLLKNFYDWLCKHDFTVGQLVSTYLESIDQFHQDFLDFLQQSLEKKYLEKKKE